jgi:hypothetical protein
VRNELAALGADDAVPVEVHTHRVGVRS